MERLWLKTYSQSVPAEINPAIYPSLVSILEESFEQYASLPAFYNLGVTLTYQQLDNYSRDFAAYLQQDLQLKKGDRIAIMLPNVLQYPIVLFAALRAGLMVVNVNPLYTVEELVHQLTNSDAETLVVLENFAHTVEKAWPSIPQLKNNIVCRIGDFLPPIKSWVIHLVLKYWYKKIPNWRLPHAVSFKRAMEKGARQSFKPIEIKREDIAFLQYTGGTTGVSKGAMLSHHNLIANVLQAEAWFKNLLKPGKEILITALPLYHIFSLTANCLYFFKLGGLNILITNPRDVPQMVKEISRFKFTVITGVNTLFNALLNNSDFAKLDFSAFKLALGGGMAVQKNVAEKWKTVTGISILEAYGLTETSPCVTINPADSKTYNGMIGLPVSSTDIAILDENGQELPLGQAGELAVKGPQVMQGYWQNPTETQKVFTKDGWLLTGDIATVNEQGFVRLLERKKDMIIVSGFNVYPNEIEDVIARIPGVRESAVIGVPDPHSGEVPKAFIVKDKMDLTQAEVTAFCREHLTHYKVPKQIEFCAELPKTNVGKILRRNLR